MRLLSPLLGYSLKTLSVTLKQIIDKNQEPPSKTDAVEVASNRAYGAHPKQKMDVYYSRRSHNLPIVIFVHGGFWIASDKEAHKAHCYSIAQAGYTVFSINYRLAPRHTFATQLKDVSIALKSIYEQAHKFKGDNQQIFLMGECSGANLVFSYTNALHHEHLRKNLKLDKCIPKESIKGLISLYGIHEQDGNFFNKMPFRKTIQEIFLGTKDFHVQVELASPIKHLASELPPTMVVCGEIDPLFEQSSHLAQALQSKGCAVQTLFLDQTDHPAAQHYFLHWHKSTEAKLCMTKILKFLSHQSVSSGYNVIPFMPYRELSNR